MKKKTRQRESDRKEERTKRELQMVPNRRVP
jgi:hypothetical protein